jgi:predicted ATPase
MDVKLTKIKIKNFKSYQNVDVELDNLNILIGPNDAGKSNFLDAFNLISDFFKVGSIAFDKRGGFLDIISKYSEDRSLSFELTGIIASTYQFQYSLEFDSIKVLIYINRESFQVRSESDNWKKILDYNERGEKFLISEDKNDHLPIYPEGDGHRKISILRSCTTQISNPLAWKFIDFMNNIGVFNFRSQILTLPCLLTEDLKLEDNGKNLPVVLQNFYNEYPEKFNQYVETIHNLYPQYEFLRLKLVPPTQIYFYLEDKSENKFPMWTLSDGLIKCLCMLYLFYSPKPHSIILFEEPEATIHPYLLNRLFDLILTISTKSQIFIATHSPYFLNSSKVNDLIYVYKKGGLTRIRRINLSDIPKDLQQEFKPGELYYSGFLDPEELNKKDYEEFPPE